MTVLTLLAKARSPAQLNMVNEMLTAEFENLTVDFKVIGCPVNKWVQVSISGEDETVATSYINREIGTCPVSVKRLEKSQTLKGYITKVDTTKNELVVDVGVFEPKIIFAVVPLAALQVQLVGGGKIELKKICDAYALKENLPLTVTVTELPDLGSEQPLVADLASVQIEKMRLWQQSLLDRLIILGSSTVDVKETLERTRLNRDVIDVERLGLFEYSLTCKLGTDAAGLIPRIGRYMRNAVFVVFSPKRSAGLIGEMPLTL